MLGGQITGGSTSVRDGWDKLRIAGAQARMMLTEAAAQQWGVDASKCTAKDGVVTGPGGKKASYGAARRGGLEAHAAEGRQAQGSGAVPLHRQAAEAPRHGRARSTAPRSSAST